MNTSLHEEGHLIHLLRDRSGANGAGLGARGVVCVKLASGGYSLALGSATNLCSLAGYICARSGKRA